MTKKILGGLFLAVAAFLLITYIATGTLFADYGSAAFTYGVFIGKLIPIVLYTLSGLFLLGFDKAEKMRYIDGFRCRSKQSKQMIAFIVVYVVIMAFSILTPKDGDSVFEAVLYNIVAMLPYLIPLLVFVIMYMMYAMPHEACKKHIIKNEEALQTYLENTHFYSYTSDNTVLANNKVLFFPKQFCIVPYGEIGSTKLVKQLWEQDVYFNLSNGKKFYIVTKHYDRIQQAICENTGTSAL